jgi:uncharacterized cupin superfamily protein
MHDEVRRASLKRVEGGGLQPDGDGWFVVNVAESRAVRTERFGTHCRFEGAARFPDVGVGLRVVEPGQPACLYHRENVQEGFLVLRGECRAIIEEEEYPLRAGDYLHLPAGTAHVIVGAGEEPCAVFMVGKRGPDATLFYPVSAAAARYGASVGQETSSMSEAYGGAPGSWSDLQWTVLGPILGDG